MKIPATGGLGGVGAPLVALLHQEGNEVWVLDPRIPKAASPESLGMNAGGRILGVCCYSFELRNP